MRPLRQRGCVLLAALLLVGVLGVCGLAGLGVATQAVRPPAVLAHNQVFWLGDRCRASEDYLRQHDCLPGYTVDLVLHGEQMRHYTVVHIPAMR